MEHRNLDRPPGWEQLDEVWSAYRQAMADPEPSGEFMPRLWEKIEARTAARTAFVERLLVWSRVLVTGSALACVLMGIGVGTVNAPSAQPTVREYVEVLDEDPSPYGEMDDEEVNL